MQWTINVVIKSAVPLMCDLEVLNRIGINYSGTTYKVLSDEDKLNMFSLDFSVKGINIEIYI